MAVGLKRSLRTFCYFTLHSSFLLLLKVESRKLSLWFVRRDDAAYFDGETSQWGYYLL